MPRKPNINTIAREVGVSSTTVHRALHDTGPVAPETRQRILEAAERLGYAPDPVARALRSGRTDMIACWGFGIGPRFATSMTAEIVQYIREVGCEPLLLGEPGLTPSLYASPTAGWPVRAVIAFEAWGLADVSLYTRQAAGAPVVIIGHESFEGADCVVIDLVPGARAAFTHLLEVCSADVWYMGAHGTCEEADPRLQAYRRAMACAGLRPRIEHLPDAERASARRAIVQLVTSHGCPQGLFCSNDDLAIGAYRGLCDLGIRVPAEVALVGFDGIEDAQYLECPLTTVTQPVRAAVRRAWKFVENRIKYPNLPRQEARLAAELVVSSSSLRGMPLPQSAQCPLLPADEGSARRESFRQ